jgi:hypothetical protein
MTNNNKAFAWNDWRNLKLTVQENMIINLGKVSFQKEVG